MSYQGIPVIVEVGNNELTIKQILSTDPQDSERGSRPGDKNYYLIIAWRILPACKIWYNKEGNRQPD